jgi:hypothetical protein
MPIALAVGSALGYSLVEDEKNLPTLNKLNRKLKNTEIVHLNLKEELAAREKPINIEILADDLTTDKLLRFEKGKVTVVFKKDSRGEFGIDVLGPSSMGKKQLREEGRAFAEQLVQAFAADRIARELEKTNAVMVDEKVTEDGKIKMTLRRWV